MIRNRRFLLQGNIVASIVSPFQGLDLARRSSFATIISSLRDLVGGLGELLVNIFAF